MANLSTIKAEFSKDYFLTDEYDLISFLDAEKGKPIRAKVLVTRAGLKNKWNRVYSRHSLESIVDDNQERVSLGLMIGCLGHPTRLYDAAGYPSGYDQRGRPPAFRVDKLWMEEDIVWAEITFLDNKIGITYSNKIRRKEPVYVSLRASGSCKGSPNLILCDVNDFDTFDLVDKGATEDAKVWLPLTDSETEEIEKMSKSKDTDIEDMDMGGGGMSGMGGGMMGGAPGGYGGMGISPEELIAIIIMWPPEMQAKMLDILSKLVETEDPNMDPNDPNADPNQDPNAAPPPKSKTPPPKGKGASPPKKGGNPFGDEFRDAFGANPKMLNYLREFNHLTKDQKTKVLQTIKDSINPLEKTMPEKDPKEKLPDGGKDPKETADKGTPPNPPPVSQQFTDAQMGAINKMLADNAAAATAAENATKLTTAVDKIITDGLIDGFKLADFEEADVKSIEKTARNSSTDTEAVKWFRDSLALIDGKRIKDKLAAKAFAESQAARGFKGKSQSESEIDVEDAKPYMKTLDAIRDATTAFYRRNNPKKLRTIEEFGKINAPFMKELWDSRLGTFGYEKKLLAAQEYQDTKALTDKVPDKNEILDMMFADSSPVLMGSDQLKNQAFISTEFQRQVYQQVQSLQFFRSLGPIAATSEMGKVVRIPALTRSSPYDGDPDPDEGFYVGPLDPISEFEIKMAWQYFSTRYRERAFRVGDEIVQTMLGGPINFDVIAEMMAQMADEYALLLDTNGYLEMFMASDEFDVLTVGAGGDFIAEVGDDPEADYDSGGSVVHDGVTYGPNVVYAYTMLCGETSGDASTIPYPIVRPRFKEDLDTEGELTPVIVNPIAVDGSHVRGKLSSLAEVADIEGAVGADFAINWRKRHFVATAAAGFNATTHPTLSYTFTRNFFTYSLTPAPAGTRPQLYYDSFLHKSNAESQGIWQDRKVAVDTVLGTGKTLGTFMPMSDMFNRQQSPESSVLSRGFARNNMIGGWADLAYMKVNGDLPDGDQSALLFAQGVNCHAVTHPPEMRGPYRGMHAPSGGGQVRLLAQTKYSMRQSDIFCTPVVFTKNAITGKKTVINFPMKRIVFTGTIGFTASE